MAKNILVTGACGTTGTSLVKYIAKHEPETNLILVDNFYKEGSRANANHLKSAIPDYSNRVKLYIEDISNPHFLKTILYNDILYKLSKKGEKIDEIYNLAAVVETPRFYDSAYLTYDVNLVSAVNLYKWACENCVDKFVNCSSSEIYGHAQEFPTKETCPSHYDSVETSTRYSYAHGKILTEYVMNNIADNYKYPTKVCHLRYANVYGSTDLHEVHVIPYIVDSIISKEELHVNKNYENILRSFLHNDDSTRATYLAMQNMTHKQAYNIGSSEEITIANLVKLCSNIINDLGVRTKYKEINVIGDIERPGDPLRRVLDTTRAKEELGFECEIPLVEGITNLVKQYCKVHNIAYSTSDKNALVVILSAGKGSRMNYYQCHKCCIKVGSDEVGITPLEHTIKSFSDAGINNFVVVSGYKAEDISNELDRIRSKDNKLNITQIINSRYDKYGCEYSLSCAYEEMAKYPEVYIVEGDSLLNPSLIQSISGINSNCILVRNPKHIDKTRSVVVTTYKEATYNPGRVCRFVYDPNHKDVFDQILDNSEQIIGESLQLWKFVGDSAKRLSNCLGNYYREASKEKNPPKDRYQESGIFSINLLLLSNWDSMYPVFVAETSETCWVNLNTVEDVELANTLTWLNKYDK